MILRMIELALIGATGAMIMRCLEQDDYLLACIALVAFVALAVPPLTEWLHEKERER